MIFARILYVLVLDKHKTLKPINKMVLFVVTMRYRTKLSNDGSVTFVLEISLRDFLIVVVDQLQKKLMKFLRKLSKPTYEWPQYSQGTKIFIIK